jgi:GNAT superfamily N-acetyltransferase
MSIEIIPLGKANLEEAASLVSLRYQGLCQQHPLLPAQYSEAATLLPLLDEICESQPGVAALRKGRLVGFITGWRMSSFRGLRSTYSPEWANAALPDDSQRIYEAMYTAMASAWLGDGYSAHYISMLANDTPGIQAWHWLGFGLVSIDALRDLQPLQERNSEGVIYQAGLADINTVTRLSEALRNHTASSPIFLLQEEKGQAFFAEWLENPNQSIWLADLAGKPVAFMQFGPANEEAAMINYDKKTTGISGAYSEPNVRGAGIATGLLNRGLEWARTKGFERCAVDFESMNHWAVRFWLRYFQPVVFSLYRHVDERFVSGNFHQES